MTTRQEFSAQVITTLARRVNYHCSNPACRKPTSGPHTAAAKSTLAGEAAHNITARTDGPRGSEPLEKYGVPSVICIENAIWLCSACHTLIDKDPDSYPVADLLELKRQAEDRERARLEGGEPAGASAGPPNVYIFIQV